MNRKRRDTAEIRLEQNDGTPVSTDEKAQKKNAPQKDKRKLTDQKDKQKPVAQKEKKKSTTQKDKRPKKQKRIHNNSHDVIYDNSDILVALCILLAAGAVIFWRLSALLNYGAM